MKIMDNFTMTTERPTVCFLGPIASFSHQATKSVFSEDANYLVPAITIEDVFNTVQSGNADFGVVPFENSTYGVVTPTVDSLADRQNKYSNLSVCGEAYLVVHHYLLGHKTPGQNLQITPPDSDTSDSENTDFPVLSSFNHVERIYSHPQALGQTAKYCSTYLPGAERIEVSSTSKAAELVAHDSTGKSAAVSSVLAAETHHLDVLAECIEDRHDNTTRFLVIRKGDSTMKPADKARGGANGASKEPRYQLMVSFTVPHQNPTALADVLDCFKRLELNVTCVNSLPSWNKPFQHLFLVEFEGKNLDNPDGKAKRAMEDISKFTHSYRWLGSWETP